MRSWVLLAAAAALTIAACFLAKNIGDWWGLPAGLGLTLAYLAGREDA